MIAIKNAAHLRKLRIKNSNPLSDVNLSFTLADDPFVHWSAEILKTVEKIHIDQKKRNAHTRI